MCGQYVYAGEAFKEPCSQRKQISDEVDACDCLVGLGHGTELRKMSDP